MIMQIITVSQKVELVFIMVNFCKNAQGLVWLDLAMTLKLFNTKNLVTAIRGMEPGMEVLI